MPGKKETKKFWMRVGFILLGQKGMNQEGLIINYEEGQEDRVIQDQAPFTSH